MQFYLTRPSNLVFSCSILWTLIFISLTCLAKSPKKIDVALSPIYTILTEFENGTKLLRLGAAFTEYPMKYVKPDG